MHGPTRPFLVLAATSMRSWRLALLFTLAAFGMQARAQETAPKLDAAGKKALELDKNLIDAAAKSSELLKNLTYLSDVIGPRLTGSAALKRANDWAAGRMRDYGLTNVHLEAWSMPEGWQRGSAYARVVEPDNGRTITLASMAWYPGTPGKIVGDVVVVNAKNAKELEPYAGKLKGAIVMTRPPTKLTPWQDIEKPTGKEGFQFKGDKGKKFGGFGEFDREFAKVRSEFFTKEGVAAMLNDSGKHFNLMNMTGSWSGTDRPSASNRIPTAFVANDHYSLLYRLATRPEPATTRMEIEINNKFIPGPIAVYNTVGEILGSERPDEFVIVGAHLDSWDLGQGTLDNGTGTCVTLETARLLAKCGVQPKRSIRFILFTGEEQGLHGSRQYCEQHKAELDKFTAAIVHDTGTGKVTGLGWFGRTALKSILETELATLKDLGVGDFLKRAGGGSDHASFDRAGVPGCMMVQEVAGYRFAHHSQADTLSMAREPDLIQGAQVMAVTAMRLANLEQMLPREKK
jgi:carboxypeptidase Q